MPKTITIAITKREAAAVQRWQQNERNERGSRADDYATVLEWLQRVVIAAIKGAKP
jgi:hypothetical protein